MRAQSESCCVVVRPLVSSVRSHSRPVVAVLQKYMGWEVYYHRADSA